MGQFSMEISRHAGSVLSGNQQSYTKMSLIDLCRDRCRQVGCGVGAFIDEIAHGRRENEVSGLQDKRLSATESDPALPFQDGTIKRLACAVTTYTPCTGALHQFRRPGGGLQECDDLGERVCCHIQDYY